VVGGVIGLHAPGPHELWEYDDMAAGWPGAYKDSGFVMPADEVPRHDVHARTLTPPPVNRQFAISSGSRCCFASAASSTRPS
jgi:hypothetical protein